MNNHTRRVRCGEDMVHVITKPQLRYRESTNPRILRMARTFPMLTTKGGRSLSVDRKNSLNPGIHKLQKCEESDQTTIKIQRFLGPFWDKEEYYGYRESYGYIDI